MYKIYISPSTQEHNLYFDGKTVEQEYCNSVADILIPSLERYGCFSCRRNREDMSLSEMIADSNSWKPNIHISLHTNAGGGRGCEVYAYKCRDRITTSERLAQCIYKEISDITPSADRGVKDGVAAKLGEVIYTNAAAVLVEAAFHDSAEDGHWLLTNRTALAAAIEKGICAFYGIDYREPYAEPEPAPVQQNPAEEPMVLYKVQVGAYRKRGNAERMLEKLKAAGFTGFIAKTNS